MIRHLLTRKPRTPRPVDPEPLTRLDRLDGLDPANLAAAFIGRDVEITGWTRPSGRHVSNAFPARPLARTTPGRHVAGEVAA